MCKRFWLMLLIVSVAVIGFLAPAHAANGAPMAVVEQSVFDFGSVYAGNDVIHEFIIQNKGDADLEVTDVKTG